MPETLGKKPGQPEPAARSFKLWVAGPSPASQGHGGMSTDSVLIIGCGSIGERHLRCFQKTGRVRVTGCDANPALLQRIRETYAVPVVPDWEHALATGNHRAAVICTPAPLHVPMALRALAAGTHVLIEKPLSHALDGVDQLLAARDARRRQVAVAYVLHVYPYLVAARDFLRSGALGPVRQASVTSGQPFHLLRPAYAQTYYRDRRTGGGAIQDALTHTMNWMESVLGPADSVLCDCDHQALANVTVEDTVHLSARHGDVLASYVLNQFQAPNETTLLLHTATGSVKIEFHTQRWGFFREGDAAWTWHEAPMPERDTAFVAQANAFLDQIAGQPSRLCSLEAAAQTLRFNLAALASAERGARVHLRDISAHA
jgi:predicted dehydrogenase